MPIRGRPPPKPRRDFRKLFGYVEAFGPPDPDRPRSRGDIVLDAVDQAAVLEDAAVTDAQDHLCIVRVSTTANRMQEFLGISPEIGLPEGSWIELSLALTKGNPSAWVLDATNNYAGPPTRMNVVGASIVSSGAKPKDGPDPLVQRLTAFCTVPGQVSTQPSKLPQPTGGKGLRVRVLDVGHASCNAIHNGRTAYDPIICYFDVGSPVFFHRKTLPKGFPKHPQVEPQTFVVLSHWDFDHYSLAVTTWPGLQKLRWIAPDQAVGPNAAALQASLSGLLTKVTASQIPLFAGATLHKGSGPPTDKNESGYVLHIADKAHRVLLAADVSYASIAQAATAGITGLGVCHHGGKGASNPPPAHGAAVAAVSYGDPNRYGHPNQNNLGQHGLAKWHVTRTAGDALLARGDRWLN